MQKQTTCNLTNFVKVISSIFQFFFTEKILDHNRSLLCDKTVSHRYVSEEFKHFGALFAVETTHNMKTLVKLAKISSAFKFLSQTKLEKFSNRRQNKGDDKTDSPRSACDTFTP